MTVGMREVELKRKGWRDQGERRRARYLGMHLIPVIWGPKEEYYVIDHHHLTLALHQEGVKEILITVVADLRRLSRDAFWIYLDNRGWLHPFDDEGRRRGYAELPKRLTQLLDDPYRSLAGELRRMGGFSKDTTPFSEFLWADFLRRRIKTRLVRANFDAALNKSLKLAKSADADFLPGWCGPSE
jgi:hypothetical protein